MPRIIRRRRGTAAVAAALGLSLVLAACGGDDDSGGEETAAGGGDDATAVDCADYEEFGDLEGTRVTVYTSIVAPEDQAYINSYAPFEECTGVDVQYEGSKEFEAQLPVRIQAGNPPDIAFIPQPGLLQTLVREFDAVVPVGEAAEANVDENYDPVWKEYGSVDGVFYAPPNSSNVKSFVWYSPAAFEENGYEAPTTWDDLIALTDQITEDHAEGATKAWCAGIGSGDATGWPATDWTEDLILRNAGPDVYDQWWKHEIPFNDPQVVEALDQAGEILKNPEYVNGGLGDVSTIATTTFQDGGLPILDGSCFLHRQASFYAANFEDAGASTVAEDGDVFAFYLPGPTEEDKPVLVGGEFTAAFRSAPEVEAFQAYLTSPEWANLRAKEGFGWLNANKGLDVANVDSEISKLSVEILQDPESVQRFDGSDLMPGAVGAGSFWQGMTDWITGASSEEVLTFIENSWPAS